MATLGCIAADAVLLFVLAQGRWGASGWLVLAAALSCLRVVGAATAWRRLIRLSGTAATPAR